jgi:hypothetical protein
MLPGNSSKNKNVNRVVVNGGKKHNKHGEYHDDMSELLLQYNLEKMTEDEYDFKNNDKKCDTYPFASTLSKDFESLLDFENVPETLDSDDDDSANSPNNEDDVKINLCIYQINTSCEIPFIEFLMIRQKQQHHEKKKVFEFPHFDYVLSKRTVLQQAEPYVSDTLARIEKQQDHNDNDNDDGGDEESKENNNGMTKFRGFLKHASKKGTTKKTTTNVYLFFQKYFKKLKHPPQLSKHDDVWWIVTSEIVNFKKVMYMDIDSVAYELFIRNPEIMHLYDCKGRLLETPTVCYFGDQFQKIKYLAFFGLLKAPIKSSFGPFYVATNFLSSMKYACYTHDQKSFELYSGESITSGKHGKYKEGGVLRMVLFIGKMKVFLKDGPPDDSQISQELARTDESIAKLMALRDSNGNWTEEYDTAYSGLYFVALHEGTIAVNTVEWFFKNYNHSAVISYHKMDTGDIPDKFDVDYTNYVLQ